MNFNTRSNGSHACADAYLTHIKVTPFATMISSSKTRIWIMANVGTNVALVGVRVRQCHQYECIHIHANIFELIYSSQNGWIRISYHSHDPYLRQDCYAALATCIQESNQYDNSSFPRALSKVGDLFPLKRKTLSIKLVQANV